VTGYKGTYVPEKNEAKRVVISGCGYVQRTVTITVGQRIDVANETLTDLWTPFLQPGQTNVMRMASPRGDPVQLYPKKPGHYLLIDRDRKYVDVDVYVFLHPLHAVTDRDGHYRIDGLPAGVLKVNTTHPRFQGEATVDLDVRPNVVAKVDLVLRHVHKDAGAPAASGDAAPPAPIH
jgi:hypothetical protein